MKSTVRKQAQPKAGTELEALKTVVQHIADTQADLNRIDGLIEAQQAIASKPTPSADAQLQQLRSEREDLRAAVAAGEKSEKDIETLNSAIADLERESRAQAESIQPARAAAQETIAGLQRRRDVIQTQLDALVSEKHEMLFDYLAAEIQAEGLRYAEAAEQLGAILARINSLDRLVGKVVGFSSPLRPVKHARGNFWGITLPQLNVGLPQVYANDYNNQYQYSAPIENNLNTFDRAYEAELARLESLGVL